MGITYVICSNFRALFVFALHISFPVDNILNKVKKVNIKVNKVVSCFINNLHSPDSTVNHCGL